MKNEIINTVIEQMSRTLDSAELKELKNVLESSLGNYDICYAENGWSKSEKENEELLDAFLSAKKIEDCSDKTFWYPIAVGRWTAWLKNGFSLDLRSVSQGLAQFHPPCICPSERRTLH